MSLKKTAAVVLTAVMVSGYGFTVSAAGEIPEVGYETSGFRVTDVRRSEILDSELVTFEHEKTGAQVLYIANDDINRSFQISFRTPAYDDTGLTHVFEHSALSGSEKYPSSTLALKLMSQTYCTFMNATTNQNNTNYMMASLSEEQLYNLADYYLSGVFETLIYSDPSIKDREAWHYELESPEDELALSGTVYSEMQGMVNDINTASYYNYKRTMFPGSPTANNPGGEPSAIPELTNEDMIEYHDEYYTPSNSITYLYGELDYEPFLQLLDSYFSRYDKHEVDIDLSAGDDAPMYTEETYDFPVSADSNTENGSTIYYAFECKDADAKDMVALSGLCYSMSASTLPELADIFLPEAVVGCSIDTQGAEPALIFTAQNVDPEDKDAFVKIVDTAIEESGEMDSSLKDTLTAQIRLSTQTALNAADIGVNVSVNAASMWGPTGDPYYYFDMQDMSLDEANYEYSGVIEEYLSGDARRSVTMTVPKAGLLEENEAALKADLAEKKAAMTDEEINAIVEATKEYKSSAEFGNDELDAQFIEQINCVDVGDLTETMPEYAITDETSDSGIRFISSEIGNDGIGQGRIMFDVSDFSEEELNYLVLYNSLLFSMGTDKHDTAESLSIEAMKYCSSCGTDIMTVSDDSSDGFTPYFIFKWTGFPENAKEIYALADEVIFGTDLSDTEQLKQLIGLIINSTNMNITASAYNVIAMYAEAAGTPAAAYMEATHGISALEFMEGVLEKLETDPTSVITALDNVRSKLYNKTGAAVVYAGTSENIAENRKTAEEFFADMPAAEKADTDYSSLMLPYENVAMPIDSTVNYNGIYIPYDKAGTEYNGRVDVLLALINDAYLTPQLRNKHNAYGSLVAPADGFTIVSYRDPEIKATFDEYGGLAEFLRSGSITQDDVDNYIKSTYSSYIKPHGELADAYWAADEYMSGQDNAYYNALIDEIKSTTVEDIREYADIFDRWYNDGIWFTAGNGEQINANAGLYDTVIGSAPNTVTIVIDGTVLAAPVEPYIADDITMVPMRSIFEALGAEVEWNEAERTVTAQKDGITVKLTIDSAAVTVTAADGSVSELTAESPAVIVDDHTMIPARLIAESLGCGVEWDSAAETVYITR